MTEPSRARGSAGGPPATSRLKPLGLGALAAALGGLGIGFLWTTFMGYDDEGYVLYSLEQYARHGGLYEQVYSQYGPFFFALLRGAAALGFEFTNLGARGFALACWLAAASACAGVVWRVTGRSFGAAAVALILTFLHLLPMTAEPSHPGGLIVALVAIMAAWAGGAPWSRARALGLGAVAAMLVLTKINVGAYFVAALLLALGLGTGLNPGRRAAAVGFWAALTAVVLRPSLGEPAWAGFLGVVVAAMLAVILVLEPHPDASSIADGSMDRGRPARNPANEITSTRTLLWGITGFGVVAAVTLAFALATGSSVRGLAEGILLGPLRHPGVYSFPFLWKPGTLAVAVVSLGLAVLVARQPLVRRASIVVPARFAVVAGYLVALGGALPFTQLGFTLSYGIVSAWVFVVRIREDDGAQPARLWLTLLLITQVMHAYPVAGTQVSWGTFLWVPLAVAGLADSLPHLGARVVRLAATGTLGVATLGSLAQHAWIAHARWHEGDRRGLPGAETLRLPESHANAVRTLAANARYHGDVLFSVPGLLSFHAWTGVPPPTRVNATHWFNLLPSEQQGAIGQALAASTHPVLIVQRYFLDRLTAEGHLRANALVDTLHRDFERRFSADTYEFWTRRGQPIAAIGTATLAHGIPGAATRYRAELTLTTETAAAAAQLEVRRFRGDTSEPVALWTAANAVFARVHVDATGRDLSEGAASTGLTRLMVFTNTLPASFSPGTGLIYVRNAAGERIGEARFIP